jgi:hypothetical protein
LSGEFNDPGWCDTLCSTPAGFDWNADGTENLVMGDTLYILQAGGNSIIKEYVLDSSGCVVNTGRRITHPDWSYTSHRALSYSPCDNAFFVGGWNMSRLWEIDFNTGTPIPGRNIGPFAWPQGAIAGAAYDNVSVGGPYLWVQNNHFQDALYLYYIPCLAQDDISLDRITKPDFFIKPTGINLEIHVQAFNRGTLPQDFDIRMLITRQSTGDTAYGDTLTGLHLESFETDTFNFPNWIGGPLEREEYTIEGCVINPGDADTLNDCLSTALKGSPPCSLITYDDGTYGNAFYFHSQYISAASFSGTCQPLRLVWAAVNTITQGEPFYPWPNAIYDSVEISAWEANPGGMPTSMKLSELETVPTDDPSWVIWVPDSMEAISTTGSIAVGFRQVNPSSAKREALATDGSRDFFNNYYSSNQGSNWFAYNAYGDWHIRACVDCPTGIEVEEKEIREISIFQLHQNQPNPFHKLTAISYQIPNSHPASRISPASPAWPVGRPSGGHHVSLNIYDITGRLIETLVDEKQDAGVYQVQWEGKERGSGIYFFHLRSGGFKSTKKMVLLR